MNLQKFAGRLINLNFTHAHNTANAIITRYSSLKMPIAFSTDLRWRPVWLYLAHNLEVAEISQCLSVSQSSVYRYIELFQRTGDVKSRSYRHGQVDTAHHLTLSCRCIRVWLCEMQTSTYLPHHHPRRGKALRNNNMICKNVTLP